MHNHEKYMYDGVRSLSGVKVNSKIIINLMNYDLTPQWQYRGKIAFLLIFIITCMKGVNFFSQSED